MPIATERLPSAQSGCLFFSLPAELRMEIYELVLTVLPNPSGRVPLKRIRSLDGQPSVLSVLRTCRLIQSEAQELFYSSNHLEIDDSNSAGPSRFPHFVHSLNETRLAAIRRLTVIVPGIADIINLFTVIAPLTGVVSLFVLVGTRHEPNTMSYLNPSPQRPMAFLFKVAERLPETLVDFQLRQLESGMSNLYSGLNWTVNGAETPETRDVEARVTQVLGAKRERIRTAR